MELGAEIAVIPRKPLPSQPPFLNPQPPSTCTDLLCAGWQAGSPGPGNVLSGAAEDRLLLGLAVPVEAQAVSRVTSSNTTQAAPPRLGGPLSRSWLRHPIITVSRSLPSPALWDCHYLTVKLRPRMSGAPVGNTQVFPDVTSRHEDTSHPLSPSCWQMLCSGSLLFRCPSNYAMKWLLSLYRIREPKTDVNRHTWGVREPWVFKPCCCRSRLRSLTSSVNKELLKLKIKLLKLRKFGVHAVWGRGPTCYSPCRREHWMKRAEATHGTDYSGVLDERSPGPQKPGWKLSRIPASTVQRALKVIPTHVFTKSRKLFLDYYQRGRFFQWSIASTPFNLLKDPMM